MVEPLTPASTHPTATSSQPLSGPTSATDAAAPPTRPSLGNKRASSFLKLATSLPAKAASRSKHAAAPLGMLLLKQARAAAASRRARADEPTHQHQQPVATLVVQVTRGRELAAKDRGGTSDPFVVIRFGSTRVTSPTVQKTLNPVWSSSTGAQAILQCPVYDITSLSVERIEVVAWDKDKIGKEYLGEISLGVQDYFGSVEEWHEHPPPIDFNDEHNEPGWFPLRSTKSRSIVSGELEIRIGFVSNGHEAPTASLSNQTHDTIIQQLHEALSKQNLRRLQHPEEDILLSSPTEGVGTHPIDDFSPLGPREAATVHEQEYDDDEGSFVDDDGVSSVSTMTEGDDTDYASMTSTETEDVMTSTEDEGEDDDDDNQLVTAVEEPEEYQSRLANVQQGIKDVDLDNVHDRQSSTSSTLPSIVVGHQQHSESVPANAQPASASTVLATNSSKRGLSLPSFMKRNSSKTLLSVSSVASSMSDLPGSDVESGNLSATSDTTKRSRFTRRRKVNNRDRDTIENAIIGSTDGATAVALVGGRAAKASSDKVKRRERRRARREARRQAKSTEAASIGGGEGIETTSSDKVRNRRAKAAKAKLGNSAAAARRRASRTKGGKKKATYTYDDEYDSVGLVQLEITGATDLPRFKNAIGVGYDMDPFVVCSFGRRVFRTRVIRHSLNPVWQEKLFFHVRQAEVGWNIAFNIHDWDKVSSNDHVGDVIVPLDQLLGTTVKSDERGLYPADSEGRLAGDDFHPHSLPITIDKLEATSSSQHQDQTTKPSSAKLQIRAKFTPYAALRQQFWRVYLSNYDIDQSGTISHLEIFSMLDSLGSTLSKETISSFFEQHGKQDHEELTYDEVVLCLENEVTKPKDERRQVEDPNINNGGNDSGSATTQNSSPGTPGGDATMSDAVKEATGPQELSFVDQDDGEPLRESDTGDQTNLSSNLKPLKSGQTVVTSFERDTTVKVSESSNGFERKQPQRQLSTPLSEAASEAASEDKTERIINIKECPLCRKPRMNSKAEIDIITHMAICSSTDPKSVNRIVVNEYVTASQAQRKWFTKMISKATKGAYQLGADSANIIVQDRITGTLLEEKMATYVRLGMRLLYRGVGVGGGMEGQRVRRMLESMTIKQGIKYDSPSSAREIKPFIDFHNLNMDEVLVPDEGFKTFNEFFYRKLKPGMRPLDEPNDPRVIVSGADCRATVFESVSEATRIWIKGREFTIAKLLGDSYKDKLNEFENASMCILRLSPSDHHRVYSCVDGTLGEFFTLPGAYYTVNPIGVRSQIDIFTENKRTVISTFSPVFGECVQVWISAMMVGAAVFTAQQGEEIKRGDEIGYFKFGGSTVVCLFNNVTFDEDLVENSKKSIETLIRVGMRIGVKID
ncbi:phosphatidylserine decarboxylase [Microbotryomycetes sp. JL221]|nr:phosphatidylserine decarboxylase [Microbotryomycetes sp. JL221]